MTAWPYLFSSLFFAWVIFLRHKTNSMPPAKSFLGFVFPRDVYRHPSATVDYKFVAIDSSITCLIYMPLITGISLLVSKATAHVCSGQWSLKGALNDRPAFIVMIVLALLWILNDFIVFLWHYLEHRIPLLWAFHQVHHSAEVLTPISAWRMHPVETLVGGTLESLMIGIGAGIYSSASDNEVSPSTLFGVNAVTILIYLFAYNLRHSHIWLSYGPLFSWFFISPAQHQIHHSQALVHHNKNFGVKLAIWDAIFGTLYIPQARERLTYGISGMPSHKFATVPRLYFVPFVDAAQRLLQFARVDSRVISSLPILASVTTTFRRRSEQEQNKFTSAL
jgi:sterol desaturase/sphingolipid hydroxylase (fatty acid hydroxylase superfamily)